jgi:hypothetical protein
MSVLSPAKLMAALDAAIATPSFRELWLTLAAPPQDAVGLLQRNITSAFPDSDMVSIEQLGYPRSRIRSQVASSSLGP